MSTPRARCSSAAARLPTPPKFVFTSSCAVFGGPLPDPVPDDAGAVAAVVVRQPEGDRRIPGLRLHAQGLHRRPQPAPADDQRASGQAEQGRVVVRERHPARAAERRRGDLPGARTTRMWLLSPRAVDRQPDRRARGAGHRVRAYAQHQRARHLDLGRRDDRGAAARRRRRRRRSRESGGTIRRSTGSCRRGRSISTPRSATRSAWRADADFDAIVRQYIEDELRPHA